MKATLYRIGRQTKVLDQETLNLIRPVRVQEGSHCYLTADLPTVSMLLAGIAVLAFRTDQYLIYFEKYPGRQVPHTMAAKRIRQLTNFEMPVLGDVLIIEDDTYSPSELLTQALEKLAPQARGGISRELLGLELPIEFDDPFMMEPFDGGLLGTGIDLHPATGKPRLITNEEGLIDFEQLDIYQLLTVYDHLEKRTYVTAALLRSDLIDEITQAYDELAGAEFVLFDDELPIVHKKARLVSMCKHEDGLYVADNNRRLHPLTQLGYDGLCRINAQLTQALREEQADK